MSRGSLVSFSGMDGSGKTTLVRGLVSEMEEQGLRPMYVYGRYQPFLLKPLIKLTDQVLLGEEDFASNYQSYSSSKRRYSSEHRLLARIYRLALIFDYSLQILVKIGIPIAMGRTVICDRYIFDTIATDLAVDFELTEEEISDYLRYMTGVFPRPDIAFLVDLPEEEAMRRKGDIPSIQYLTDRRWVYHLISDVGSMVVLDGLKPPGALIDEAGKLIQGGAICQE